MRIQHYLILLGVLAALPASLYGQPIDFTANTTCRSGAMEIKVTGITNFAACTTNVAVSLSNNGTAFTNAPVIQSAKSGDTLLLFVRVPGGINDGNNRRVQVQLACDTLIKNNFVITNNTAPTVSTVANPTSFCNGASLILSTNPASFNAYQWLKNGLRESTNATLTGVPNTSYAVIVNNGTCLAISDAVTPPSVTVSASITGSGPTAICSGNSATLNASPTGGGFTYQWTRDNVNINGATNPTFNATTAGDYRVVVTQNGCSSTSAPRTVTVATSPTAAISPATVEFCPGGSATLTASPTGGGATYVWERNNTVINGATSSTLSVTQNGTYTVIVTQNGCSDESDGRTVTVLSAPNATINPTPGNLQYCAGSTVSLEASPGSQTYLWSPGGATTRSINAAAGNFTVIVTNGSGCKDTASITVPAANPLPVVAIETDNGATSFCKNTPNPTLSATLTSGTTPFTYLWSSTPGGFLSGSTSGQTIKVSTSSVGTPSVILRITDSKGCIGRDTLPITVLDAPSISLADLPDTVCSFEQLFLKATCANCGEYVWSSAPTSTITNNGADASTIPNVTAPTEVTYQVIGKIQGSTCADTASREVLVLPSVNFQLEGQQAFADDDSALAHPVLVISGQELPLSFNSGGSAFQATFTVIGSSAADIENFDAGPVTTDPFKINWELTEGDEALIRCEVQATPDGCSKFFYLRVLRLVDIADILTPNDDGTNDTWTLDINDAFDDLNFVLSIYGRNGARIVDQVSFEGEYTWDGAGCPDGVYFYVLESGDNAGDVILPTLRGAITLLRN